MAAFKAALGVCGLSQAEAASYLRVSLDTVKSWCSGRGAPPLGVWRELAALFERIQDAADGAADAMSLEGIDPRAYNHVEADIPEDGLPAPACRAAGAMALLIAVAASAPSSAPTTEPTPPKGYGRRDG